MSSSIILHLMMAQFWIAVIQLFITIVITLANFFSKKMPSSLKNYWLMFFGYFFVLAVAIYVFGYWGFFWIHTSWIITIYWFFHVRKWINKLE